MKRIAVLLIALVAAFAAATPDEFHFVILGDRTGEAQPGVWERVWRGAAESHPAFILGVGDLIQGQDDATAEAQWRDVERSIAPWKKIPLYLAPGNHDVWSPRSAELYRKHSGRPLHYSFDYGPAHFTVLDNSRSDALPEAELTFLEADLRAHPDAAVKFVVMHRPSWLTGGALHQIAKRYNVRYWIAGHVHQLIHAEFDGITYYCAPSAGGHLRLSGKYEDGWFFGWTRVDVKRTEAAFQIQDLAGRSTSLHEWGLSGLKVR
jgi:Icc protein